MKMINALVFCSATSLMLLTACTTSQPRNEVVRSVKNDVSNEARMGNVTRIDIVATSARTSGGSFGGFSGGGGHK